MNEDLKDTIDGMLSSDYKERFKAEYSQLVIRYNKLREFVAKYEAKVLSFEPSTPLDIYKLQLQSMDTYMYILEVRAKIENIM